MFPNELQVELCSVQVADETIPLMLGVNEEYSLDVSADGDCMISAQTVPQCALFRILLYSRKI